MTTILIVDDHQQNRDLLTAVLGAAGYQLLEASDGAEALELARARRPDLVIADLIMPTMDGFAMVRALRADPALAQTRVIFFSATYLEREAQALARASGVEQILAKPATSAEILAAVALALAPDQIDVPGAPLDEQFDREHIRVLTNKLATNVDMLTAVNARLSAQLDLSRRLALEHRPAELLHTCCDAARGLIDADFAAIELVPGTQQPVLYSCADDSLEAAVLMTLPERRGLLARLREASTPLRVHEVGFGTSEHAPQLRSFLGVPIASATQRYGSLYLLNKRGAAAFSQDDEYVALTLAAQTAVTYENVHLYEALRHHAVTLEQEMAERTRAEDERARAEERLRLYTRRLETLHAIDQAIMTAQSPEMIVEVVLRYLRQLIPCRRASVALFNYTSGCAELWRVDTDVPTQLTAGVYIPLDQMWNYPLLRQGLPTVMHDLAALESRTPSHQHLLDEGIRSYISVPLQEHSELIGALNLSFEQPGAGVLDDVESVRALADQLAVAIQHLRLFTQVRVGRERLQVLSQQLVRAQEDERRHLARELHDEIGQSLTAAQLNLQGLMNLDDQADLPARLEDSLALIDRVLQQVRALSLDLRPSMLDDLGLAPALRWYVKRQADRAGFRAQLNAGEARQRYPSELETTCFRIAQEALNNIVRYAQASEVVVELWEEDDVLHMTVRDDGRGFDVAAGLLRAARGQSLGLVSMQERASLVGGRLEIDSAPRRGTTIRVQIPLDSGADTERRLERRRTAR
jgi:signal transduction histidine kinase